MKKSELSSRAASETSLSRADADRVVNTALSTIGDALADGETVRLSGSGTFSTRGRAARQGRNPRTGERIAIQASKAPSFKAGEALRDAVN